MQKISFQGETPQESAELFILEQTRINGVNYILVTDSEDEDGECMIMKDTASDSSPESLYEFVEDDMELTAISKVFEELLEDIDIER